MTHFELGWFVPFHRFNFVPIFLTKKSLVDTGINEKLHINRFRQLLMILDYYFN